MLKKLSQLSVTQINWAVARTLGHRWRCPWIASVESYQAWIAYEHTWGNPHPDYCNDWNAASPIMMKYGIFPEVNEIHRHDDGSVTTSQGVPGPHSRRDSGRHHRRAPCKYTCCGDALLFEHGSRERYQRAGRNTMKLYIINLRDEVEI